MLQFSHETEASLALIALTISITVTMQIYVYFNYCNLDDDESEGHVRVAILRVLRVFIVSTMSVLHGRQMSCPMNSEADLGMFSMFGRTGDPTKRGPHKRTCAQNNHVIT